MWSADITFVPMPVGFMYLVAVIDWYSRYVLAWRLSKTLDTLFCLEALDSALAQAHLLSAYGKSVNINRNGRSSSIGMIGHDQSEWAVSLGRNTHREGSGRRLDPDQEREIQKLLLDKTPDQLKMPYALWTRESVRELVKERLGIVLPTRTVGHYLKRWGMTPQKPVKQAYEQQPARVQKWLDEEYPAIQMKAKEEARELLGR